MRCTEPYLEVRITHLFLLLIGPPLRTPITFVVSDSQTALIGLTSHRLVQILDAQRWEIVSSRLRSAASLINLTPESKAQSTRTLKVK